jgi:hypothetical protein
MTFTGTVSDFDEAGLFGLIIADDGGLLLFNLRGALPALRSQFEIGTRVTFTKHESEPTVRAVEVAPIDEWNGRRSSAADSRGRDSLETGCLNAAPADAGGSVSWLTAKGRRRHPRRAMKVGADKGHPGVL